MKLLSTYLSAHRIGADVLHPESDASTGGTTHHQSSFLQPNHDIPTGSHSPEHGMRMSSFDAPPYVDLSSGVDVVDAEDIPAEFYSTPAFHIFSLPPDQATPKQQNRQSHHNELNRQDQATLAPDDGSPPDEDEVDGVRAGNSENLGSEGGGDSLNSSWDVVSPAEIASLNTGNDGQEFGSCMARALDADGNDTSCATGYRCAQRIMVHHSDLSGTCRTCTKKTDIKWPCGKNEDDFKLRDGHYCCALGDSDMDTAQVEVKKESVPGRPVALKAKMSMGRLIGLGTFGAVYRLYEPTAAVDGVVSSPLRPFGVVKLLKEVPRMKDYTLARYCVKNEIKYLSKSDVKEIPGVSKLLGTLEYPGVPGKSPVYETLGDDVSKLQPQPQTQIDAGKAVALILVSEVLEALQSLHELGIAHADIKAENIMASNAPHTHDENAGDAKRSFFKIVDFGFSFKPIVLHPLLVAFLGIPNTVGFRGSWVPRWRAESAEQAKKPNKLSDDVEALFLSVAHQMWPGDNVIKRGLHPQWCQNPSTVPELREDWCQLIPESGEWFKPICESLMSQLYGTDGKYRLGGKLDFAKIQTEVENAYKKLVEEQKENSSDAKKLELSEWKSTSYEKKLELWEAATKK